MNNNQIRESSDINDDSSFCKFKSNRCHIAWIQKQKQSKIESRKWSQLCIRSLKDKKDIILYMCIDIVDRQHMDLIMWPLIDKFSRNMNKI